MSQILLVHKSNADELREVKALIQDVGNKGRANLEALQYDFLSKTQELRNSVTDLLQRYNDEGKASSREHLAQDRIVRDSALATLADRLDKVERDSLRTASMPSDSMSRGEFESKMKRVWETVESHSYSLASLCPSSTIASSPNIVQRVISPPATNTVPVAVMTTTPIASQRAVSPMSQRTLTPSAA